MGQQPNMPLTVADLPRPEPHPAPARPWRAGRPGDPAGPAQVPWGGAFGTPGPDTGYALHLLAGGFHSPEEARALAAIAGARASRMGRAPVAADVEAAEIILAPAVASAGGRLRLEHGAEGVRRLLESLDAGLLTAPLGELRRKRLAHPT